VSTRLVDRAVRALDRRSRTAEAAPDAPGRRSFLGRATMAATAMAVAPTDFVLRPTSAYAAICRCQGQGCPCGSLCCDGYTEFCCTLTGQNGCPPGTVAGGWWKVDGSAFCGGAPRYYLDCNAQCGSCGCGRNGICSGACSGTPCGCAWGDCNNRKAGCVQFRYGQCHQELRCIGPIVCRIVTCTPPWVVDGSCTTASRTDNRTAQHHRPCLDAPFGAFDAAVDVGGAVHVSGWAIDQNLRDGVEVRLYVDEAPATVVMADIDRPDVGAAYPYYGSRHGFAAQLPMAPGRHTLCVYAVDQGSGAGTFLAFREVDVAGALGNIDGAAGGSGSISVSGWAVDQLDPARPATVLLLVDGTEVVRAEAGAPRPDVGQALPGVGDAHGFDLTVGAAPGPHEVCLLIVPRSGVVPRLVACASVVVS